MDTASSPDMHATNVGSRWKRTHTQFCYLQVECLANRMLPYLPTALQVLMHVTADCQDMCDVVALLNQLMLRFKTALQDLLKEVRLRTTSHLMPSIRFWLLLAQRHLTNAVLC